MSFLASVVRIGFKLSGIKKMFGLPEEQLLTKIKKLNHGRNYFVPKGDEFDYEDRIISNEYHCLVIRQKDKAAKRAILFFFGGGMMIGPDGGDISSAKRLAADTGCDVWFPFYPLCTEHCITETYAMSFECYRQMCDIYGEGNVSTYGFSSGGMLALGMAAHNSAAGHPLPQPAHIIAISPGECPCNDAKRERMRALDATDVGIDYRFMESVGKFMRHGEENVPEYMLSGSLGDYTGVGAIQFCYSEDEVLYGALFDYKAACERAGVPFTITSRPGMVHCYPMAPYFRESKEDYAKLIGFLKG